MRQNAKSIFAFAQSEPNGVKLMYDTWGRSSSNLNDFAEFQIKLTSLPQYHFMAYDTGTHLWSSHVIDINTIPKFRYFLKKEDIKESEELGLQLVYGNSEGYNLSSLEQSPDEILDFSDDDQEPLFLDQEPQEDENLEGIDPLDPEDDAVEDLKADLKPKKRSLEPKEKKSKKAKKEPSLMEQIDQSDGKENIHEELSKEDNILAYRLRNILGFVQENECPDQRLLAKKWPEFFQLNIEQLPFRELKDVYRRYFNIKKLSQLVSGISSKYDYAEAMIGQFFRSQLGFEGDPKIFLGHFEGLKQDSIINGLSQVNPYKKVEISGFDQAVGVMAPVLAAGIAVYQQNKQKEKLNENLSQPVPLAEEEALLNPIQDPPVEQ